MVVLKNKSHAVTAQIVVPDGGAEGVIVAQGGAFGGWSLYLKDGRPAYCYNLFGLQRFKVHGETAVAPGEHQVRMEFAYDGGGLGKGGTATLYVDGAQVGEGRIDATVPMIFSGDETTDVGTDGGTPVSDDLDLRASRFTGRVRWVEIDLGDDAAGRRPPHHARGAPQHRDGAPIGVARTLAPSGYLADDARSAAGARVDPEGAADGRDAVGEVGEADAVLDERGIEAGAVVLDAEPDAAVGLPEVDRRGGAGSGVLGHVLQALLAAEVDRRLDRLGVASAPRVLDADGHRRLARDDRERRADAEGGQELGIDAVRDRPQLVDGFVDLDAEALEHPRRLRRIELLGRDREVDAQRHEALLGAVVQVALDAPPLGVAGLEDPLARGAQLALEVTVLDRQERGRRRCAHQLGILRQRLVDHHRRHRPAVALGRHPHAPSPHRRGHERRPVRFPEAAGVRVVVPQSQGAVVERRRDRLAPLIGCGS